MYGKLLSENLNLGLCSPHPTKTLYLWSDHHVKEDHSGEKVLFLLSIDQHLDNII